jgi:hypothetical protein
LRTGSPSSVIEDLNSSTPLAKLKSYFKREKRPLPAKPNTRAPPTSQLNQESNLRYKKEPALITPTEIAIHGGGNA